MTQATKFCPRCQTEKSIADFYVNKARADGLSGYCVECQRRSEEERRARRRAQVIEHLGGKCGWPGCTWDDPRALCIDHVNGGGTEERSLYGSSTGFMAKVIADTEGKYQLLCANHNFIKRIEQEEHKGARVYTRTTPTERKVVNPWTPERRAAHSAKLKGREVSEEERQHHREAAKKRWADPQYRAAQAASRARPKA